ncbi:UNVERIFIED_CONTAM: hypothetical protein Sindi_1708000 [Sesamum indicum]
MDESSGNTTSSLPSRTNSPHDTELSWTTRSNDGDEETDSSDMPSDEEKYYEVLCPSYIRTKQPQHISSLQGSDWVGELISGHPDRIFNMLQMKRETFQNLCSFLQERGVLLESEWSRVSVMDSEQMKRVSGL